MLLYHSLPIESRARNLQVQVARPLRIQQQPRQAQRQHQQLSGSPLRQKQHNQGRQLHTIHECSNLVANNKMVNAEEAEDSVVVEGMKTLKEVSSYI